MAARSVLMFSNLLIKPKANYSRVYQRGFNKYVRRTSFALRKRQETYFEELKPHEKLELEKRHKFSDWNYSSEIYAFGKRLHEEFMPELLVQAFTHRSYIVQEELKYKELEIENTGITWKDNEQLADLGEKIIAYYVPRYVSHFFPRFPIEGINGVASYLLSEEVLAHISKNLGTTFLILSSDFPVEPATYAKTMKAIVGALHESQNLKKANLFVRDLIVTQLAGKNINDFLHIENPLQVLNDILKRDGKEVCEPRIICQTAVNTILANYHIGLYSSKQLVGHSSGESVEIAIQMAANDALRRLFHTTDSCSPIKYDLEDVPEKVTNISLSEWNSNAFTLKHQITA